MRLLPRVLATGFALAVVFAATVAAQRGGVLPREAWKVDGVDRTAVVAVPAASVAKPAAGSPLVLVFHGHGGTSTHSARTYAIHTHWPEAVVIYAQGLPTPGRVSDPEGRRPGWQHAPGEQGDRDLKFVDAMIAWARTKHAIDPKRVYAAGHSNGGTMSYLLWAARGDVFAAVAPSASVFRRDLVALAKPKPALIIAGQKDQLVPFVSQRLGLNAALRLNGADRTGVPWSDGAVLHKSSSGADVVAYIHGGDHTMPANAGAMMAKFFKEH